jgi:hypothetical protein
MKIQIFNGCLLAGWFLLTLGGILYRPEAGLMIGGLAIVALTIFVALRFGIYEEKKGEEAKPTSGAG